MDAIRAEKSGKLDSMGTFEVDKEAMKRKLQIDQRKFDAQRFHEVTEKYAYHWEEMSVDDLRFVVTLYWQHAKVLATRLGIVAAAAVLLSYWLGDPFTEMNNYPLYAYFNTPEHKLWFGLIDALTTGLWYAIVVLSLYWANMRLSAIGGKITGLLWIFFMIFTWGLGASIPIISAANGSGFTHIGFVLTIIPLGVLVMSRSMFYLTANSIHPVDVVVRFVGTATNFLFSMIRIAATKAIDYLIAKDTLPKKEGK